MLSARQLAHKRRRAALWDARVLIRRHVHEVEQVQCRREALLHMLEDPKETLFDAKGDQFFDTDVIHGTPQRVRPSQLFSMVEPLITHSSQQLNHALQADRMVLRFLMHIAGAEISRIARGYLWRVRVREFRRVYLQNVAAVTLQALWRGFFVRKYIVPLFKARRATRCAIVIQRITRGWLKRLWYSRVLSHRRRLLEAAAAVKIQAAVRGWTVYRDKEEVWEDARDERAQWDEFRQKRLERARARRWQLEQRAATNIQRVMRGLLARREAYMRRQQGFISHPRVRELADAYLSGGDLWGLLAAVNQDYERRETDKANDSLQTSAFIDQMVRLREERRSQDWREWQDAKKALLPDVRKESQAAADHRPPSAQERHDDAKLALLEQMYLSTPATDAARSGTAASRLIISPDKNEYLARRAEKVAQEKRDVRAAAARAGHVATAQRSSAMKRTSSTQGAAGAGILASGPEEAGEPSWPPGSRLPAHHVQAQREHAYTAPQQPLTNPIDGSHPADMFIPTSFTKTLAQTGPAHPATTSWRAASQEPEQAPLPAGDDTHTHSSPRRFTAPSSSPVRPHTSLELAAAEGATRIAGLTQVSPRRQLSAQDPAPYLTTHVRRLPTPSGRASSTADFEVQVPKAPFHSGALGAWDRPLAPGGALVAEDGYMRPHVMNSILEAVDRLASREIIRARGPDDGRPVSPATMLMLKMKAKKQAIDREAFTRHNKGILAEGSEYMDTTGKTYVDEEGRVHQVAAGEAAREVVVVDSDSPREVVAKHLRNLSIQSVKRAEEAAAGRLSSTQKAVADDGAAREEVDAEVAALTGQHKSYRQIKYEMMLETARVVSSSIMCAAAETLESLIVRERMDDQLAQAIASGTSAAGAGPEGYTRLASSGILGAASAGALSKAASRVSTATGPTRPGTREAFSSRTGHMGASAGSATLSGVSVLPGNAAADLLRRPRDSKPHILRDGTAPAKTFKHLTRMGYHVLHGRAEPSNPYGRQWAAGVDDQDRIAAARAQAKARVRKERHLTALADSQGAPELARAFGLSSTGSESAQASNPAAADFEFNDEPLPEHLGVPLGQGVEEDLRREKLLQGFSTDGKPGVRTLLRDIRGMKGPMDALIIHAALRVAPVPQGALTWAQRAGLKLSTELTQLSAEGKPLLRTLDSAQDIAPEAGPPRDRVVLARSFSSPATGEEAARVFAEIPASMVKVQWERLVRGLAAPTVSLLAKQGCEVVGDVANVDLDKLPIDPRLAHIIVRLLAVIKAATKLTSAGVVREVFAAAPPPVKPPLVGPYAGKPLAGNSSVPVGSARVSRFLSKPGASGGLDVNASSLGTTGHPVSYDPPGGSALIAVDSLVRQPAQGSPRQASAAHPHPASPRQPVHEPPNPTVAFGSQQGGSVGGRGTLDTASGQRVPISIAHTLRGQLGKGGGTGGAADGEDSISASPRALDGTAATPLHSRVGGASVSREVSRSLMSSVRGRPPMLAAAGPSPDTFLPKPHTPDGGMPAGRPTAITKPAKHGTKPAHPSAEPPNGSGPLHGNLYVQVGLYTGFSSKESSAGRAMSAKAVDEMFQSTATGGKPLLQTSGVPESDLLSAMHAQQALEESHRMEKFMKARVQSGLREYRKLHTAAQGLPPEPELMLIPDGFSILERDDALSAPCLKAAMQRRAGQLEREQELKAMAASSLGQGLAHSKRKLDLAAKKRSEELARTRAEEEAAVKINKQTAFQRYYTSLLSSGSGGEVAKLSGIHAERAEAAASERSLSEVLQELSGSLNGLKAISDLNSPIDVALIQVAFVLPLPAPRLVAMSDHRTGVQRSDRQRLRVLVPHDVFLRQVMAYMLPQDVEGGLPDPGGSKKQRMLVKERTRSAATQAQPWIAALVRWGFSRIGQLVGVPHAALCKALKSAYPIRPQAGATPLDKACMSVADALKPEDIATSLISALQHWQQCNPDTFQTVKQAWTSFDRRYQRGPTDLNGRPKVGRELAALRKLERGLGSANWNTFAAKDMKRRTHGWARAPATAQLLGSIAAGLHPEQPASEGHVQGAVSMRHATSSGGDGAKPLLSPLWFGAGAEVQERLAQQSQTTAKKGKPSETFEFLMDYVAAEEDGPAPARAVGSSAGGVHLPREAFLSGAPTLPSPVQTTVEYVTSSSLPATVRDGMGITAAGAIPMQWQHDVTAKRLRRAARSTVGGLGNPTAGRRK